MSRSKKDGRKGGGHYNTTGKEYWSPRKPAMGTPGRASKDATHTRERAETRRVEHAALFAVRAEGPDAADRTPVETEAALDVRDLDLATAEITVECEAERRAELDAELRLYRPVDVPDLASADPLGTPLPLDPEAAPSADGARMLWVDDAKPAPFGCDVARTYDDALRMLRHVAYDTLYLDHDLGDARTGYDLLMTLIAEDRVPAVVQCISWNAAGRDRIHAALADYRRRAARPVSGRSHA